jgi:hypothetical protein
MPKSNFTTDDKKIPEQGDLFRRKKIKKITALTFALVTALVYSQWEIPTLLHGREFDNAHSLNEISYKSGNWLSDPKFIKIIDYSETKADILWVISFPGRTIFPGRDTHLWVEFVKKKSKSGKMEWVVDRWRECTPANGTPQCFFPWYGGISIDY